VRKIVSTGVERFFGQLTGEIHRIEMRNGNWRGFR
jgi:hypothetical protein